VNNPLFTINEVLADKISTVHISDKAHDNDCMSTLLKSVFAAKTIHENNPHAFEDKVHYYYLQTLFDKNLIITVPRGGKSTTKIWDYFQLPIYTKFDNNYSQTFMGCNN
jgi:hypothetical protein